jgi:hypothetical protein
MIGIRKKIKTNALYSEEHKKIIGHSINKAIRALQNNASLEVVAQHLEKAFRYYSTLDDIPTLRILLLTRNESALAVEEFLPYVNSALHIACKEGALNSVQFLLEMGAYPNTADVNGTTPLISATEFGHEKIVRLLLANRATVNVINNRNLTPLRAACMNGNAEIIDMLMKKLADLGSINVAFLGYNSFVQDSLDVIIMNIALTIDNTGSNRPLREFNYIKETIGESNKIRKIHNHTSIGIRPEVAALAALLIIGYDGIIEEATKALNILDERGWQTTAIVEVLAAILPPRTPLQNAILARCNDESKNRIEAMSRRVSLLKEELIKQGHTRPELAYTLLITYALKANLTFREERLPEILSWLELPSPNPTLRKENGNGIGVVVALSGQQNETGIGL